MKIRAIRLREVGCFKDAVALEGLSGGLDVLAGPNELGKSTILKALRLLLFAKHTTTHRDASELRPRAGGSPLIEADFEIDGRTWRLRKQFLSGKQGVLTDLEAEKVVARGEEAHEQALSILRGKSADKARLLLLWVGQKEALKDLNLDEGQQAAWQSVVESQIHAVADGGRVRAVRKAVTKQLAEQFTQGGKIKANSPYDAAIKKRDRLNVELDHARALAGEARTRLQRLQDLHAKEQVLGAGDARHQRAEAVTKAQAALNAARSAREKCRTAVSVLEKCQGDQKAADKALGDFKAQVVELAKLESGQAEAAPKLEDLHKRLGQADEALGAAKKQAEALRAKLKAARARLKALEQAEKRRDATARQKALALKLAEARRAEKDVKAATANLEDNKATRGLLEAARREAADIGRLEAQLSAASPKVSVALVKGGAGKITVDGKAVGDGAAFERDGALVLDIEGVGTITVAPGGLEQLEDMRADIVSHKQELSAKLAAMAATDLPGAEKKLEARRDIEGRKAEAGAKLSALAPDGLAAIEEEARQLEPASEGDDPADPELCEGEPCEGEPCEALERQIGELEASEVKGNQDVERRQGEAAGLKQEHVRRSAKIDSDRQRVKDLAASLPRGSARSAKRDRMTEALQAAERAVNAANRDLLDWQEKAGSQADHQVFESTLGEVKAAKSAADKELTTIRLEMKQIEGALNALAHDGIETRVAELEGRVAQADAEVLRRQNDAASLQLLRDVLAEAESQTRERFLSPVLQRVAPYLDLVLPGAVLEMGDGLEVHGLARSGDTQPLSILSDGTREQIAVLVRLGFGRLLADSGAPAPLILDDALVYSDDGRLASAFEALRLASEHHQVIMLTCRTSSFDRLGGKRLELTPWRVD